MVVVPNRGPVVVGESGRGHVYVSENRNRPPKVGDQTEEECLVGRGALA